jgi:hypothetical protein
MGADIEFCTYMKNRDNTLEILMSVNDQLSFKYEIPENIVDSIITETLDNNIVSKTLYDDLFYNAKQNNNLLTAICIATFSRNKETISDAIMLNHNCSLSKTKREILQRILKLRKPEFTIAFFPFRLIKAC